MSLEVLENGAERYVTEGGVSITRQRHSVPYEGAIDAYVDGLNSRRGAVFSSNYEYPGRYTRWDTAIIDPPVVISARGRVMHVEALNRRGRVMLSMIAPQAGAGNNAAPRGIGCLAGRVVRPVSEICDASQPARRQTGPRFASHRSRRAAREVLRRAPRPF